MSDFIPYKITTREGADLHPISFARAVAELTGLGYKERMESVGTSMLLIKGGIAEDHKERLLQHSGYTIKISEFKSYKITGERGEPLERGTLTQVLIGLKNNYEGRLEDFEKGLVYLSKDVSEKDLRNISKQVGQEIKIEEVPADSKA